MPIRDGIDVEVTEPVYPANPEMPEVVKNYCKWFQDCFGWNPFEGIICINCKEKIYWPSAYRCYDCKIILHKECLIKHCQESRQFDELVKRGIPTHLYMNNWHGTNEKDDFDILKLETIRNNIDKMIQDLKENNKL